MANDSGASRQTLRQSRAAYVAVAAITLLITGFSLLPEHLKRELAFDRSRHMHLASHFVAFAMLAFVLRFALRRNPAWLALLIAVAIGTVLEVLEHLAYGAPLETRDIALDMGAAFVGVLLATTLQFAMLALQHRNG